MNRYASIDRLAFETLDAPALTALRSHNLPRCTLDDIATIDDASPDAAEVRLKVDEYLRAFLPPGPCVCCDYPLGGILGTFAWSLAHGEGECSNCTYPARAIHHIGDVATVRGLILQYHPDELTIAPVEASGEEVPW